MNNIKSNFVYNILYQLLIIILPLITVPYVSRVLGSEGVGIYSYTYSIVYYFMILAMLGINNYGNRTIAKLRDNRTEMSKNFFEIYYIQFFSSLFFVIMYIIYVLFLNSSYRIIAFIQVIYLISNMLDINWFFFGLEKFKLTVTRNTIIKVISLILIFIVVKDENDLWKYTLILSLSSLVSQLLLFPFLIREIDYVKININSLKKHIKPIILLFIPVVAVSLYKVMDKVMLGILSNVNEVGFYEQAEKITQFPLGFITALGTVMMPRMSYLIEKGKKNEIQNYIEKSLKFVMFLSFPMVFGLIAISDIFIPIFLGTEFLKSSILLKMLSFTMIFISFANVLRTQYLIPNKRDKDYIVSVLLGAIVNVFINLILIPKYSSIGACIGTIVAEAVVCIYQAYVLRNDLNIKQYLLNVLPYFFKSLIMFLIVYLISLIQMSVYVKLCIQILFGIIIYILLNYEYILGSINIKKLRFRE